MRALRALLLATATCAHGLLLPGPSRLATVPASPRPLRIADLHDDPCIAFTGSAVATLHAAAPAFGSLVVPSRQSESLHPSRMPLLHALPSTPSDRCVSVIPALQAGEDPVLRFYSSDPAGFDSLFERCMPRAADEADAVLTAWVEARRASPQSSAAESAAEQQLSGSAVPESSLLEQSCTAQPQKS